LKKRNIRLFWGGIIGLAVLLGGPEVRAEFYSIQLGAYQKLQNAQRQLNFLKKSLPSNLSNQLRIEKTGKSFEVKVGKAEDFEQALTLLSALKDQFPDAFICKGDWSSPPIPEIQKTPTSPEGQPIKKGKEPAGKSKKTEPSPKAAPPLLADQAMIIGIIREVGSIAAEQLGMPFEKNIYRLIIRLEASKAIKGGADFLKEREGELLTVFSETNPPFFSPGKKITAIVEYRGNRFSRFFWIHKPQPVNP
jgi:hypothetical protein